MQVLIDRGFTGCASGSGKGFYAWKNGQSTGVSAEVKGLAQVRS